jgi:hypothetical protein
MRKLVFAGLVGAAFLLPAVAAADTLTSSGSTYGFSVGEGGWVNIQIGGTTETGWAGEINWVANGTQSIVTYCADLFDDALTTQNGMTVSSSSPLTSNSGEVAWLVDNYGAAASSDTSGATAEALQIAIWDTMYAATPTISGLATGVSGMVSSYLGAAAGQTATAVFYNAASGSGNGQGQVQGTPEPSSIFLMMLGTCVAFGYRYRLKRSAGVA